MVALKSASCQVAQLATHLLFESLPLSFLDMGLNLNSDRLCLEKSCQGSRAGNVSSPHQGPPCRPFEPRLTSVFTLWILGLCLGGQGRSGKGGR